MKRCPEKDAICNRCHKKGLYARACQTKTVYEVNAAALTEDTNEEIECFDSLTADVTGCPWKTEIKIDQYALFKIDTGADVTAVPVTLYNKGQFNQLRHPERIHQGPGRTSLKIKVKFTAILSRNTKCTKQDIYVVEGLDMPLLGRQAAMALQLVARLMMSVWVQK